MSAQEPSRQARLRTMQILAAALLAGALLFLVLVVVLVHRNDDEGKIRQAEDALPLLSLLALAMLVANTVAAVAVPGARLVGRAAARRGRAAGAGQRRHRAKASGAA